MKARDCASPNRLFWRTFTQYGQNEHRGLGMSLGHGHHFAQTRCPHIARERKDQQAEQEYTYRLRELWLRHKGAEGSLAHACKHGFQIFEHIFHRRLLLRCGLKAGVQLLLHETQGHAQIGAVQRFLNGRELLANFQAILALFNHALNAPQLAFSTAQAVEYVGAGIAIRQFVHFVCSTWVPDSDYHQPVFYDKALTEW